MINKLAFLCLLSTALLVFGCTDKNNSFSPLEGDNKNIKTLRVGISPDYPPLGFKEEGKFQGAEVEMAKTLAYYLNVKIVFVELPWKKLIPGLLNNKVDVIMSGITITPERERYVNFAQPYIQVGQMTLIRKNEKKQFPNIHSLLNTNLRAGYLSNTTSASFVTENLHHAQLMPMLSVEQAVDKLRSGKIDLFIHDAPTIWLIAGNATEEQLTGLYWPLTRESLAWAVRPSDITLLNSLNSTLNQWKQNGVLQKILNSWMKMRIEIEP